MNTDSYNMLKTAATLIYLYIALVVSLQWPSYHDICWPNVLSPFTWTVIHQRCYWSMLHWYLHTYLHCSNDMWVMSFEILVHITFRNDTFYLHRGRVILNSSSILQHSGTYSVFCYPSRLGGIPWLQQFNNFKGFSTVSYVRHIIELISYSGSFPVHISARGMFAWLVR